MTLHVAIGPLSGRRAPAVTAAGVSLVYAAVGAHVGAWTSLVLAVWAFTVVVAAVDDAVTARLRDGIIGPGTAALTVILLAEAVVVGPGSLVGSLLAAGLFGGWFLVIHLATPTGLGFGDVKFAVLLGLGIGVAAPGAVVLAMFLAVVIQVGICLVRPLPAQRSGLLRRREAPFGPALTSASLLVVLAVAVGGR